jgi:hypothetical protein
MIGSLAQIIALITYGNYYINSSENKLNASNDVFQYCCEVNFAERTKLFRLFNINKKLATDTNQWFNLLKTGGCQKLRLIYLHSDQEQLKDYMSSGFVGGGGRWLIECKYNNRSEIWESVWTVKNQEAPDNRIWSVSYYRIVVLRETQVIEARNYNDLRFELKELLIRIREFAAHNDKKEFVPAFQRGIDILDKRIVAEQQYYKDMVCVGSISEDKVVLIMAASASWVFGAMGSWNDGGYEDDTINKEYEELTSKLYDKINEIIVQTLI